MKYLKTEKKYNLIAEEVKRYIIDEKLKPGDKLPTEQQLCEMMGVSRNILREGMKLLQAMGIIKSVSGEGNIIQKLDFDRVMDMLMYDLLVDEDDVTREINEIRAVLEVNYLRQVFDGKTREQIEKLEGIVARMQEKAGAGLRYYDEDYEFHSNLFLLDNKTLRKFLSIVWRVNRDVKSRNKKAFHSQDAILDVQNHMNIVEALKEDNYEKCLQEMKIHFHI